jgi:NADH-ubiquinone oxidoreductase chain 2
MVKIAISYVVYISSSLIPGSPYMLILSIILILLSNAVNLRRDMAILYNRISLVSLFYCGLISYTTINIISKSIGLHGGLLLYTNLNNIFHAFIFIVTALILVLTAFYPAKIKILHNTINLGKKSNQFKIVEYPLIILFIVTGAVLLISTNDLISIFLAIELQSYGLYILSTIYRNSELSTTGGLIYFLLGGLSSCFILLGTALLYSNTGSTSLDNIYIITNISDLTLNNLWYKPNFINISLILFVIGFLFKVSAAPFHFWSPDVYDAIPTVVTTFVAIIAKISIFVLLLQIVYYTKNNFSNNWTYILLITSLFSLIVGTVVGLTQFRIKRLFAYSTISHVGFILLALGISTVESTQAFIFYLTQYTISNLNAFIILLAIGYTLYYYTVENKEHQKLLEKNNSPVQLINQLKGYFFINPVLSLSLTITIFSFVGIPPLVGFFAKQMVLSAALDSGLVFLALVAILTSVIGGIYYLTIIKEMFFSLPDNIESKIEEKNFSILDIDNKTYTIKHVSISSPISFIISNITLIILLFLFMNKEWLSMGTILVQILFNN